MHRTIIKCDKHGKNYQYCKCCGYLSHDGGYTKVSPVKKLNCRTVKSAQNWRRRNYFGYIPKKKEKRADSVKKEETKPEGLLGQLKGFFKTRDNAVQVLRNFEGPPGPKPNYLCIDTHNSYTHEELLQACKTALGPKARFDGSKVVGIQFVTQKVLFCNKEICDRWIVELNTRYAVKRLVESGVVIGEVSVPVRSLDDVLAEEYKQFLGIHKMAKLLMRPQEGPKPPSRSTRAVSARF